MPGHLRMSMASISSLASLPHALAVGPCGALGGGGRCRSISSVSSVSAVRPEACEPVDPDFVKLLTRYSRPCPIGPRGGPPETRFPRCSTRLSTQPRRSPQAAGARSPWRSRRRSATASDRERKIAARSRARSSVPARDARRASKGPTLTEIPEHLLKRSRERRAALGLPTDGGEGTPAEGGAAEAERLGPGGRHPVEPGTPRRPRPRRPVGPSRPPRRPHRRRRPDPPYVAAAKARTKIPLWAMPVVGLLPLWVLHLRAGR